MSAQNTRAFILRSVNYKESDKILTLYTQTLGKVSAIAKAARKSRKRFGGALEPFALFDAVLESGRGGGNMFRIVEATMVRAHYGLASDLRRMGAAAFLLELIRELMPSNEPEPRTFSVIENALNLLDSGEVLCARGIALAGGMRILALNGLAISVSHCNACGKPVPSGKRVFFDPRRGGVVCTPCGAGPISLSAPSINGMMALEKNLLENAGAMELSTDEWQQIESAFDSFLEMHLEKTFNTVSFREDIYQ